MNKLLMAGLISAVVGAGAQAAGTVCHPGGFYAGLNVGFVAHKAQLKMKETSEVDGTAAKLLAEIKKAKDGWEKGLADATTAFDKAKTDSDTKTKAESTALAAAEKAYSDKLIHLYTATGAGILNINAANNGGNDGSLPDTIILAGGDNAALRLGGFSKILLHNPEVKKTFAVQLDATALSAAITAPQVNLYNEAIKTVIPQYVKKLFAGTLTDPEKQAFTVEKIVIGAVAQHTELGFTDDVKKTNTDYISTKPAAAEAAKVLTNADKVLKAKQAKVAQFADALGTDKEVKLEDLKTDETIKAKITAVNKLEMNELLANANGKLSKTKSGFVAETVFGFDHRINDMMVGAELFVGFDTSKMTLRDKKVSDARKTGTADKSVQDGIELKRQFYFGIAPRIGCMFTPELEGYLMIGAQLNKYKIDATGMAIVYDHTTNILNQAVALNEARTKGITDAINAKNEAEKNKDEAKKTESEANKKFYEGIHEISTTETFTERNKCYKKHNKTKFAPIVGVGIRYAFTPDVFGTLQYKYQFSTKVADTSKTSDFQLKDQNHTFTVGVGFRF